MDSNKTGNIEKQIDKLLVSINKTQQELKKLIHDLYNQKTPFPSGRDDTKENFLADLHKFKELIAYSMLISDFSILETFAIIPLKQGDLPLATSKNFIYYLQEFSSDSDYVRMIEDKFHQLLVDELVEALNTYAQKKGIHM